MVTALRGEHVELEKKLNAYIETVTVEVMCKIASIEHIVAQKLQEQPPQTLSPRAAPVHGGRESFKVISSGSWVRQ